MSDLRGVPSIHYAPAFAARVRDALATFRPTAIALEAPPEARPLYDLACAAWPTPVAGVVGRLVLPLVPGDAMLEAYRLGRAAGVAIHLVDPLVHRRRQRRARVPSSTLAARVGDAYDAVVDALDAADPPQSADLAREATMARLLATLLRAGERVLWVGGMAHWRRIATRVVRGDFAAPAARPIPWREPECVRLSGEALLAITGRSPWSVRCWAEAPEAWDERDVMRALALAAAPEGRFADVTLVIPGVGPGAAPADDDAPPTPADVAKVLTYARNLAATSRVADCPSVGELVQAAEAVVGRRYAGRVYALATEDAPSDVSLPTLSLGARPRLFVPGWGGAGEPVRYAVRRVPRDPAGIFGGLPEAAAGERKAWQCWPPDEAAYERFVRHVLRHASTAGGEPARSLPFRAGLRDGLDVRTTLRRWHERTLYVREDAARPVRVTNGIVDWAHASEDAPDLQHPRRRGWIDPTCTRIGSASRDLPATPIHERPFVQVMERTLSLVTLDLPTWRRTGTGPSFYDAVIDPLTKRRGNLYDWLDVFFAFCAGKTVAYYARYVPGPRIHAVARRHRVRVAHVPLARIPTPMLERARRFRFAWVTRRQWDALLARAGETWVEGPPRHAAPDGG